MLAKTSRITTADEYRAAVRRGTRFATANMVVYVRRVSGSAEPRFGFIVSKAVGVAVIRNRVRRRLKAASFLVAPDVPRGLELVVRALPSSAAASFDELKAEVTSTICRASTDSRIDVGAAPSRSGYDVSAAAEIGQGRER